jgi:hypothetical protein
MSKTESKSMTESKTEIKNKIEKINTRKVLINNSNDEKVLIKPSSTSNTDTPKKVVINSQSSTNTKTKLLHYLTKNNIDRSIIHNYANIIRIKLEHIERYLEMMKAVYDNSAGIARDFGHVEVDSKKLAHVPSNDESFLNEYSHLTSLINDYRKSLEKELTRENLGTADSKLKYIAKEVGIIADRFANENKRMLASFRFKEIKKLLYKQSKENQESKAKKN